MTVTYAPGLTEAAKNDLGAHAFRLAVNGFPRSPTTEAVHLQASDPGRRAAFMSGNQY